MNVLADMLFPALALSGAAALCLVCLPHAPPRARFVIACMGLGAWLVPWPLLELPIDASAPHMVRAWLADPLPALVPSAEPLLGTDPRAAASVSSYVEIAIVALVAIGAAWFALDCLALRSVTRGWRERSRSGESLRALLPAPLRDVRARIRRVEGTRVAAASGWLEPIIWIGEGLATEEQLRLALLHESWHVRRRDPMWLMLVTAVRRLYWWNPIAAYLSREALVMIEAGCDRRCIESFGKRRYMQHLASLLLEAEASRSCLVAAAAGPGLNVRRLKLLEAAVRWRARDRALIGVLLGTGLAAGALQLAAPAQATMMRQHVSIPATPAGRALTAVLEAFNNGDSELLSLYLGAYTPQEVPWQPAPSSGPLAVAAVLRSEPLRIEYAVEADDGAISIGTLQVAGGDSILVTRAQFRSVSSADQRLAGDHR